MVEYMDKMDNINVMAAGVWQLPPGCVVSAMHCVTRPSDLRAFERTGTAYPVRTVIDLTKSGVNDCMPRWPFRMESIDAAVRLIAVVATAGSAKQICPSTSPPALCTQTCSASSSSRILAFPRDGKAAAHRQQSGWPTSAGTLDALGPTGSAPASRSASGSLPPSRAASLAR